MSNSTVVPEPRLANIQDLAQLHDIQRWRDEHESSYPNANLITRWVESSEFWVAELDGDLIGWMSLEYNFFEEGFIGILWVNSSHRRKGIASGLVNRAREICRTHRLWTSTNLSNHQMQELLQRLGWKLSGALQYLDPEDPELVYVHTGDDLE